MVRKVNALLVRRTYSTTSSTASVCRDIASMLAWRASRPAGTTVGFVPTMGGLHSGHVALAERARRENDHVVVSIYVNPTQFGKNEDLAKYPRDLSGDMATLKQTVNVDCVFAPDNLYTASHRTDVVPVDFSNGEGLQRPGKQVNKRVNSLFIIVCSINPRFA